MEVFTSGWHYLDCGCPFFPNEYKPWVQVNYDFIRLIHKLIHEESETITYIDNGTGFVKW